MNNYFTLLTKMPIVALLLTGLLIFVFHFINPCWWSVFFVLLWILIATININGYIANNKYLKYVIVMVMLANGIYSIYYSINRNMPEYGMKCIGYYEGAIYQGASYYFDIGYYDEKNAKQRIRISHRGKPNNDHYLYIILFYLLK